MTKPVKHVETMGERMRRQAQRIAERYQVPMPWRPLVTGTMQRDAARAQPLRSYWRRIEANASTEPPILSTPLETTVAPMPSAMRDRVSTPPNGQAIGMRLHEGPLADALARERRADAVTIGQDVYLRERPRTAQDDRLPLLAHEATHVRSFLDPHAAWHRSTSAGVLEEEIRASASERPPGRSPLLPAPRPSPTPASIAPSSITASASSPRLRPMHADTGRNAMPAPGVPATPSAGGMDMRTLRDGLMRDLIETVRVDAERGG